MNTSAWLEIGFYFVVLLSLVKPLGWYMARVYSGQRNGLDVLIAPVESLIYRFSGIQRDQEMSWQQYALAMLVFNGLGAIVVFLMQITQAHLPLNPQHLPGVAADLAFNSAISFATNTNWQAYSGESTLSYFTQMLGLTVQNFVSASSGMAVLVALIRGLSRRVSETIGNFWVDLTRSTLYILLPLSLILAILLVSQGVVQSFSPAVDVALLETVTDTEGNTVTTQTIPLGPAASQIAIKQLGTNGGGFYGVNSAHPLENSTPFSNFLQSIAILLIPAALCYTFGDLVGDTRQGWCFWQQCS